MDFFIFACEVVGCDTGSMNDPFLSSACIPFLSYSKFHFKFVLQLAMFAFSREKYTGDFLVDSILRINVAR